MRHLLHDLRFGIRGFFKTPGFTIVAVLVLGLGIGANSAIFTIVNQMMLKPLGSDASAWVGLYSHDRTQPDAYRGFSYPNYIDIRERSGVFAGLAAHSFAMVGVPVGEATRRTFVELVSSNYFDTLGVSLAAGRPFTADEERPGARVPVVIVSYQYWRKQHLDPAVVGRTIRINAETYTIVGIAPAEFSGTMALVSPEMFLPLGVFDAVVNDIFRNDDADLANRSNTGLLLIGRLKSGLGEGMVNGRLEVLSRQLEEAYPAENKNQLLSVSPLPRMSSSTQPQTNAPLTAFTALLLCLSGAVLLIACLNLANMLLARGAARRKEVAVRLALGASRGRIITQLLTEGLTLALSGAAVGLALSYWTTRALALSMMAVMPLEVVFNPAPDAMVLAVTAGVAILSTVAFGLGPALKLSRRDLVTDLKDLGEDRSLARRWFAARNVMVVGQVALCLALLVAAGIFSRAALVAADADPGYRYDDLVLASLDPSLAGLGERDGREQYRAVLDRVRSLPGVRAAGMASTVPFGDMQEGARLERVGVRSAEDAGRARTYRIVSAGYFAAIGVPLVRGRDFTVAEEQSATAPPVCIIDEALARRLFGAADPLGQMVRVVRDADEVESGRHLPMQVVGIAPPLREELMDRAPVTHLYVPFGRQYRAGMHVHIKRAPGLDDAAAVNTIRKEIRAVDSRLPILALSPMQAFHDRSLELWAIKAGGQLFGSLGLLALTLAVVGVYGVKSYVVSQRTREIGIRMALGASASDVLRLILNDGLRLAGAGLALGVPLAVLLSLAFTKVFVEIGGIDLLVIGVATTVLGASAIAASAIPAWRAARIVPLKALRTE